MKKDERPDLTILTAPIYNFPLRWYSTFRYSFLPELKKNPLGIFQPIPEFGGHPAVTRSLIHGLQQLSVTFNYNPQHQDLFSTNVAVLSNIDALKQAIKLKEKKRINRLIAGPNLMVLSNQFGGILGHNAIDRCIVPSDWVGLAYQEDNPDLLGKISVWYSGVDERFWKPQQKIRNKVLIYWKTEDEEFCRAVENILLRYDFELVRLKYGTYDRYQYRETLNNSIFAVFISRSESQGIALAEAWAMDVPTLVWDPKEFSYQGRDFAHVTSSPYLTENTGHKWTNFEEFDELLSKFLINQKRYHPRKWIIDNMTDKICAERFLALFNE